MGWKEAVIVSLFRIIIGSFFTGNLFTPGFFLSLSGGLSAVFLMGMLYYFKIFSLLTVSIGGSLMHNLAQLIVAAGLLFKNAVVWYLLPYLLLSGVLTGVVTGLFSYFLLRRLSRDFERKSTGKFAEE
jgi:heptaprenyl diphosphate synthase